MKKLIVIAIVSMMASFQAFAVAGVDCNTPDARCSAFELTVEAEVLASIDFNQITALDLGQVTKGEVVTILADGSEDGQRGKSSGNLEITHASSDENIVVSCIASSSNVDFGNAEGATAFDSCDMEEYAGNLSGSSLTITPAIQAAASTPGLIDLYLGGQITVPSNATDGAKSGVMRVEVAYQ